MDLKYQNYVEAESIKCMIWNKAKKQEQKSLL